MRVTDLDEFARKEIWHPYLPALIPDEDVARMSPRTAYAFLLGATREYEGRGILGASVAMLEANPEVAKMVIRRLKKIGVTFPTWIHHPLVDYLRQNGIDND